MIVQGDHPALNTAAAWLRDRFQIPDSETIVELFEQYFDCEIFIENRCDPWMYPDYVIFDSDQHAMMFLLRWS